MGSTRAVVWLYTCIGPVVPESGLQVVLCEYACTGKMAARMHFKVQEKEQIYIEGTALAVALGQSMTTEVRGGVSLHLLPIKENRHSLHSYDHRLSVRCSRAGVISSSWPGFFLS